MNILDKTRLLQTSMLAGLMMGLGGTAYAQINDVEQVPAATDEEFEESDDNTIVVTGSRIRRPVDSIVPITSIDAQEIEKRAFTNIGDAINDIPLVSGSVTNAGANTQFGDNNAFANLLNLGTNRTLTLVNGQRFVGSNQATIFTPGNAPGAQVDLTILNPALIERTELQTVGGGAVYGADALAGVINIILKDDFEGFDITAQAGITEFDDGENYRISGAWGKNFLDGRANLTLAAEYFDSDIIRGGGDRDFSANQIVGIDNPASLNGDDLITSTVFRSGIVNPLIPTGGLIVPSSTFAGGTGNLIFPNFRNQTGQGAAFDAFVADQGVSPFAFGLDANNAGVNPLLFLGTFGNSGLLPTIANTDPATSAFLPRLAVPFGFQSNGDLVPFSFGDLSAVNTPDQNSVIGGDGFADPTATNIVSGQERISLNALFRFDVTDNITYKGNFMYAEVDNQSIGAAPTNVGNGGQTSFGRALPIYINENPFLSAQARGVLAGLAADGFALPQLNGQDAVFLSRNLSDLTGDLFSGNVSETFRTSHVLQADFNFLDRDFNWQADFVYGRNTSDNIGLPQILDIEFALATDVVLQGGQAVCRQQTLAAPEDIAIRNPELDTDGLLAPGISRVPTQAQIDACVPLNLFGEGNASQAAIDNVIGDNDSRNESEQFYAATSLGGEVINLPAGPLLFNVQGEYRKETLEFIPGTNFAEGRGRNTSGEGSQGSLEFIEYGGELLLPVFGDDFRPIPFLHKVELEGALRVVRRTQETDNEFADSPAVENTVYTLGGRWSIYEDFTARGQFGTAVRSAAIVELFGAPQTGFTNTFFNPCNPNFIDGGPDSGVRRRNCETTADILGFGAENLADVDIVIGGVDAATAGNPFLQNERAESWTAGAVWQPDFIPGFSVEADWFSIDISDSSGLAFPNFLCFDQDDFPNGTIGGTPICDQVVFNIEDPANPGQFIIPATNPLTGSVLPSPAAARLAGNASIAQEPLQQGFVQFPQLNQAAQEYRGLNATARYNFELDKLGEFGLAGTLFYVDRNDTSGNGEFTDTDPAAGEPGNAEFQTRLDVNHRYDKFSHQLQWFRNSATVDDITVPEDEIADQSPLFENPATNVFNYSVAYEFTDNLTGRFIANNITREQPQEQFGVGGRGRTFAVAVNARF